MKTKLYFLIIVAMVGIVSLLGCGGADETRVNVFISNNPKPIVVKSGKPLYDNGARHITLQSANGQVILLEYSFLALPDTIK